MQRHPETFPDGPEKYKVLVPVSMSREEEPLVQGLYQIFRGWKHPVEITLFHALTIEEIQIQPGEGSNFYETINKNKSLAEAKLREHEQFLKEKLPAHAIRVVIAYEQLTSPVEAVQSYLRAYPSEMVVIFYKGRQRWEGWVGRTAFWDLFEELKTAVLVLSQPFTFTPKRFLWLCEMDEEDYKYLPEVLRLIKAFEGSLYCAKVNTPGSFYGHREFQRRVLAFCDYIVEHVDPDFVPQECLQYNDKDVLVGARHLMEDFLMDVLMVAPDGPLSLSEVGRLLATGNFGVLRLPMV